MVPSTAGAVVLIPFPFSDLSHAKLRPAVALADASRGDWILCQVTSNTYADPLAIAITDADFRHGSMRVASFARPGKLFTASHSLIVREVGVLLPGSLQRIVDAVINLLRSGLNP